MTILKITVEDENAGWLKKLLLEVPSIKSIEETPTDHADVQKTESALEQIKKIQKEIGDKELFKEIKDPSEWQREIRKEWDRDF